MSGFGVVGAGVPVSDQEEALGFLGNLQNWAAGPTEAVPLPDVVFSLVSAVLIGSLIGWTYRLTHTGTKIRPSMPHTLLLLCVGGCMIWLVVGNNLVRAFGLAGTIGLIRYRTSVPEPKDTTILLFSMVLGMACGLGQFPIAMAGAVTVLGLMLVLWFTDDFRKKTHPQPVKKAPKKKKPEGPTILRRPKRPLRHGPGRY